MPAWSSLAKSSSDRAGSSLSLALAPAPAPAAGGGAGPAGASGFLGSTFTAAKSSSISELVC
jgi:hypothetical protein